MDLMDLMDLLQAAQNRLAALPATSENFATTVALADAVYWQVCRQAVEDAAGGREHPQGLGWCEV